MASKLQFKTIYTKHEEYKYGFSDKVIREITYKGLTFRAQRYSYTEYATEDEPAYKECCSDCYCCETEDYIGEDTDDYATLIVDYVNNLKQLDIDYKNYIKKE